ncbi:DUF3040 domain-containing protein [Nocardioides sp.]|uniref:DUF3040 domain-containing protein n=1 Tax=Nocardioides sp. TaxID=35761 RepID=UPI0035AEE708
MTRRDEPNFTNVPGPGTVVRRRPPWAAVQGGTTMIVLGLILLILGLLLPQSILTTLGIILIVVGLVLNFVPIGGNSRRVW